MWPVGGPEAEQIINQLVLLGQAGYLRHQEVKEFRTVRARLNVQIFFKSNAISGNVQELILINTELFDL